jgi:hypothetical protein
MSCLVPVTEVKLRRRLFGVSSELLAGDAEEDMYELVLAEPSPPKKLGLWMCVRLYGWEGKPGLDSGELCFKGATQLRFYRSLTEFENILGGKTRQLSLARDQRSSGDHDSSHLIPFIYQAPRAKR